MARLIMLACLALAACGSGEDRAESPKSVDADRPKCEKDTKEVQVVCTGDPRVCRPVPPLC